MPRNFLCHGCGIQFPYSVGAGLFHSADCEAQFNANKETLRNSLIAAGFTQDPDASNLWTQNGVAVSLEQVVKEGFAATLAVQSAVVQLDGGTQDLQGQAPIGP